ncbi:hypothetical protein GYMLUDRAFT_837603 [Collybiopsis luxurians FD-317 M1]|uniref:Carrier domain-containing protein n=1 Tax=Collybiopsis luxurians FD-317 M1 TaxID=944289 RepID=A0A0D0BZY3_9AGAR|nr:hypothetical protein GYMLUDRAFT_837603 [Collybiopsis luxurians FD-317 M1]
MNTPPLTQLTTLPQLLRFHYEHNAEQAIYVYAEDENPDLLLEMKYLEFVRASHRAAHILRPHRAGLDGQVVAIAALLDTFAYTALVAGLMEAGFIPLPISPRNTVAAVVNLLKKTGCRRLLATQSTLQELIRNVQTELASSDYKAVIEEAPTLKDLYPKFGAETSEDPFEPYPFPSSYPHSGDTAVILHSSGSTGFPKPIPITYEALLKSWALSPSGRQFRTHNLRLGTMSLPTFHVMGFTAQLIFPVYLGITVAVYPPCVTRPEALPLTPTPDNIIDHFRRTHADSCIAIPAMLQIWSQSALSVDTLRSMRVVMTGGGPLAPATGDYLVSCGVKLRSLYGGTEFGSIEVWDIHDSCEDWSWHRFPDGSSVRWMPQGDGTFELQCLNTESYCVSVENLSDTRGYATADLWISHPSKPNLWSIVGRVDDVLIHSSGEKTVPGPFEEFVSKSPCIIGAVMFGRQRDQPGVLLEPSAEHQIDVKDESQVAAFRNKIWPVIEEANKLMPTFSKVYKEMILAASPSKPLPRAGKGTVLRKAAYEQYQEEINQIYDAVESTLVDTIEPPSDWESNAVQRWLKIQIEDLCHNSVGFSEDIFEHGFDSLCATILRRRMMNALREGGQPAASRLISQNVVYNHPTITKLADFIVRLVQHPTENGSADKSHETAMEDMISLYSQGLDAPITSCTKIASKTVVLLTGSTGNLGAQILASLLENDSVGLVYTLNRSSSRISIQQRHLERFEDKGLDINLLKSDRLIHLEGESSQSRLGLAGDVFNKLRNTLTVVIHNAWRLDFNLSLSSFEPHVRGTRNLIDLARSSRHSSTLRFLFTSSIGSAQSWNSNSLGPYPERVVLDPQYAVGSGYGESKYVSERILAKSGLHVSSFRIGQITGSSPTGAWAMSDWLPMMIKSSLALGVLPDAEGPVSWAPMDAIAEAILDVAFAKDYAPLAINLVHPHPVSWTSVMEAIRQSLISYKQLSSESLQLVPFQTWVSTLQKHAASASADKVVNEIPAMKIIEFLRAMGQRSEGENRNVEALGGTVLETENVQRFSERMKNLDHLGRPDAELWVKYWVRHGL